MGKRHHNYRGDSLANQRNHHDNLRKIRRNPWKNQRPARGVNNLKTVRAQHHNAFDIRPKTQTPKQVVARPTVNFLNPYDIKVINNVADCQRWLPLLKSHCDEYNIIGFDCEWVPARKRRPVALLQFATHHGLCLLIRLCLLRTIPKELKEILEDNRIVKVGVVPEEDGKNLVDDYGIRTKSTLDLRHLAKLVDCEGRSLKFMSEKYLNIKISKNRRFFYRWERHNLEKQQIEYAAKDVYVAIELFKFFTHKLQQRRASEEQKTYIQWIINDYCKVYIGKRFVYKQPRPN